MLVPASLQAAPKKAGNPAGGAVSPPGRKNTLSARRSSQAVDSLFLAGWVARKRKRYPLIMSAAPRSVDSQAGCTAVTVPAIPSSMASRQMLVQVLHISPEATPSTRISRASPGKLAFPTGFPVHRLHHDLLEQIGTVMLENLNKST